MVLARSAPEAPCPEKSGVLRVSEYHQSVALESDGAHGTKGDVAGFVLSSQHQRQKWGASAGSGSGSGSVELMTRRFSFSLLELLR